MSKQKSTAYYSYREQDSSINEDYYTAQIQEKEEDLIKIIGAKTGKKHEDRDFPPDSSSIGPSSLSAENIEWARIQTILKTKDLYIESANAWQIENSESSGNLPLALALLTKKATSALFN